MAVVVPGTASERALHASPDGDRAGRGNRSCRGPAARRAFRTPSNRIGEESEMLATAARAPDEREGHAAPDIDHVDPTARIQEILSRHPAVGLAVGVVRDGRLASFHGHGVADIASRTPITQDTAFRVASITKTFTAIAVMQLWEQGLVDLDAPANDYLRAYRLVPAKPGWRPATVRHLLTHTAGLPEVVHPLGRVPAGLRREREGGRAAAVARGVLPRRSPRRRPSRAPGSATATTGPPRSARSWRT